MVWQLYILNIYDVTKYKLDKHVYMRQDSQQLNFGDTFHIWMWYGINNRRFDYSEKGDNNQAYEISVVTPNTHKWSNYSSQQNSMFLKNNHHDFIVRCVIVLFLIDRDMNLWFVCFDLINVQDAHVFDYLDNHLGLLHGPCY